MMRQSSLPVLGPHGFYRMAYTEWGAADNPRVLICVHGLTLCARDFDYIAQALSDEWRVVCPDMPGRGESDWLDVKADYAISTYASACAALIARLGVDQADWLGTSMGGIIGMHLACLPKAPITRLIVNDVGPFIPKASLQRIGEYVGADPRFSSFDSAEGAFRRSYTSFGLSKDEHWRHFVEHNTRPTSDGKLRLHYDPGIAQAFLGGEITDIVFWPAWDAIRAKTLVLRGADSDLLLPETAQEMTQRGPKADVVTIPGCGHAPPLMEESQIALVRNWLEKNSAAP